MHLRFHGECHIAGYHIGYFLFGFPQGTGAFHAEKADGSDGIPGTDHGNNNLFRVRIVFCDRLVGRAFREKIPVKQSFFHILTERLPLILFTLRPGSCDDLILVTDAEKFSAGF